MDEGNLHVAFLAEEAARSHLPVSCCLSFWLPIGQECDFGPTTQSSVFPTKIGEK
jgi:hypothetical protein